MKIILKGIIDLAQLICSILILIGISWIGFPVVAAIASTLTLATFMLYQIKFKHENRIIISSYIKLGIVMVYMIIILPTFIIPIKVPEVPKYEIENMKNEEIILSEGESINLYHFSDGYQTETTPVLFINGGPGGNLALSTLNFLSSIHKQGYDVFAYDHYSSGYSQFENPDSSLLTIKDEVRRLDEMVNQLAKENKIHLVGHSYAGALVGRYLAEHSEKIETVTFLDTSPLFDLGEGGNTKEKLIFDEQLLNQYEQNKLSEESSDGSNDLKLLLKVAQNRPYYETLRIMMLILWNKDHVPVVGTPVESSYAFGCVLSPESPVVGLSTISQKINGDMERSDDYYEALMNKQTPPLLVVHPENGQIPWEFHKDYESFFDTVQFLPWADAGHSVWDTEQEKLIIKLVEFFEFHEIEDAYKEMISPFAK